MRQVQLKFSPALVPLVLSGEKDVTWRVGDEKQIKPGDTLLLYNKKGGEPPFGSATVVSVVEKSFADLTAEDTRGHEKFESIEEMLKTYQEYYPDKSISLDTPVKIIRFVLL